MSIAVLVVDDHEIVRKGVSDALSREIDIEVIGEASTVSEALAIVHATHVDVATLDVRLPDGDGVELCREIMSISPNTRCLMLTSFDDDRALVAAVVAGAAGYLLKGVRIHELLRHIRDVASGRDLISADQRGAARARLQQLADSRAQFDRLSAQERRIFELITKGLTNKEIAREIFLAEKTVRNYVSNLLVKLGMSHRGQVAAYGAKVLGLSRESQGPSVNETHGLG